MYFFILFCILFLFRLYIIGIDHELSLIVMTYVYFIYYDDDEILDVVITSINYFSLINQDKYKFSLVN